MFMRLTWVKLRPGTFEQHAAKYQDLGRKVAGFRARWLAREELVEKDLSNRITVPKLEQRLPKPMPPDELAKLLEGLPRESPGRSHPPSRPGRPSPSRT